MGKRRAGEIPLVPACSRGYLGIALPSVASAISSISTARLLDIRKSHSWHSMRKAVCSLCMQLGSRITLRDSCLARRGRFPNPQLCKPQRRRSCLGQSKQDICIEIANLCNLLTSNMPSHITFKQCHRVLRLSSGPRCSIFTISGTHPLFADYETARFPT